MSTSASASVSLFEALEAYPWSQDESFQTGLLAILGPSHTSPPTDDEQKADLTLRARVFYYTRAHNIPDTAIDFDAYKAWREQQPDSKLAPLDPPASSRSSLTAASLLPPNFHSNPGSTGTSAETTPTKSVREDPIAANGMPSSAETEQTIEDSVTLSRALPEQPPPPASFAEIMNLIQRGEPIPGIKEIPDTVLHGRGTSPGQSKRRKPWEQRNVSVSSQSGLQSLLGGLQPGPSE